MVDAFTYRPVASSELVVRLALEAGALVSAERLVEDFVDGCGRRDPPQHAAVEDRHDAAGHRRLGRRQPAAHLGGFGERATIGPGVSRALEPPPRRT